MGLVVADTRAKRSYAFVVLDSPEDASTAISKLDGTELNGRKINVEIAKPPTSTPAGRVPKEAAEAAAESSATTSEPNGSDEAGAAATTNGSEKKPRTRAPRKKAGATEARIDDADPAASAEAAGGESSTQQRAARGNNGTASATKAPVRRKKGPPENGTESETGVFVSNLNRKTEESALQELFKEYDVTSLRLSTFNFGSLKGKSRGFAFVHFANREQQQKALAEVK